MTSINAGSLALTVSELIWSGQKDESKTRMSVASHLQGTNIQSDLPANPWLSLIYVPCGQLGFS